jgi:hypothetical protein
LTVTSAKSYVEVKVEVKVEVEVEVEVKAETEVELANAAAMLSTALTFAACRLPDGSMSVSPPARTAAASPGRPTSVTACPASASRAPTNDPTAPAPMIRTRKGVTSNQRIGE